MGEREDKCRIELDKSAVAVISKILKWRMDVAGGEMIETRKAGQDEYTKQYLKLVHVTAVNAKDSLLPAVNAVFVAICSELRVEIEENCSGTKFLPTSVRD